MNKKATICESDRLAIILDDQTHPDYEEVAAHVETCVACQQQLETLAGDESWWNRAARHLPPVGDVSDSTDFFPVASNDDGLESSSKIMLIDSAVHPQVVATKSKLRKQATASHASFKDILDAPGHPEMLGRLDKYDIEAMIGRGGMGIVFKGFDHELNRPVAIKVMAPHLSTSGVARRRFAREARAAAAVVHPHVVPIFGVDAANENPYIVMPFIGGDSLQAHVEKHGPLETKEIVRAAMHVSSGLAAAHAQGLVHRDVKPANILIDQNIGRVMITDFGLARAADDVAMTQTGWLAGTPHYMSPEQASGKPIDERSDLFSLGSVMYFLATGRMPFRAELPMAVLNKICHEQAESIREINPDIPRRTSEIIGRLLEKNPDDRFASAKELNSHLSVYLAHLQQPTIYPAPKRTISKRRKKELLRTLIALCISAVSIAAIWFIASFAWLQPQQPGGGVDRVIATDTQENTPEIPPGSLTTSNPNASEARSTADSGPLLPDEEFEQQLRQLETDVQLLDREVYGWETLSDSHDDDNSWQRHTRKIN